MTKMLLYFSCNFEFGEMLKTDDLPVYMCLIFPMASIDLFIYYALAIIIKLYNMIIYIRRVYYDLYKTRFTAKTRGGR